MVGSSYQNGTPLDLLEMTFQAQVRVALCQHLWIDRTRNRMAGGASLAQSLMFKHKWAALRGVAFKTAFVLGKQSCAARSIGVSLMGRMTLGAGHFPFRHRMVIGKVELAPNLQVTLVAYRFHSTGRMLG